MAQPDAGIRLIETLRVEPAGKLPLLAWHERRLRTSCSTLGYRMPAIDLAELLTWHTRTMDASMTYRLRLLVARDGSYTIESHPLPITQTPVRLYLHPEPLAADKLWLAHKTTHRPWYDEAQQWLATHPAYFDVLYANSDDLASEGSRSNIYIQDDQGQWLTPGLESGLLPGVQRQALIDQGLAREARLSRSDLLQAKSLRVSNALRGWLDALPLSKTNTEDITP
jgi:4-amino-4-deoxychorismate lyase